MSGVAMQSGLQKLLAVGALAAMFVSLAPHAQAGSDRSPFAVTGDAVRAPGGWVGYCGANPQDCAIEPAAPRDAKLTPDAWRQLVRINKWVNDSIMPMTDIEHFGTVEKWTLPNDGYGDCEDYALLKQKLLIEAGWPRQALLMTVVRDKAGAGHAVLTVKSDQGEYVLDNQIETVELWSDTGYRFLKRQSQSSPNVWVSLGDPRPTPPTATSH
jgi:predicted transglutaminase-like cysteine proteinase